MEHKTTILGHVVSHDESTERGVYYLSSELDDDERKVFFDQAFIKGRAVFEDHSGVKYELSYTGSGYQLKKHI